MKKKLLALLLVWSMLALLAACGTSRTQARPSATPSKETVVKKEAEDPAPDEASVPDRTESAPETADHSDSGQDTSDRVESGEDESDRSDAMSSDFLSAMNSYEAFMDEYVAFMKKYSENPSDLDLLRDYASYMAKYSDLMQKFENWEDDDLNDAEMTYYLEVQMRVNQKLLEAAT